MSTLFNPRNPYIIGRPVTEAELFFGRETLFQFIEDNLSQSSQVILLHGQRRIGKSSILSQVQNFVKLEDFVFIILSLEGKSQKKLPEILYDIAREILDSLDISESKIEISTDLSLYDDPLYFADQFLSQIRSKVENKKLVLLLDEFDTIASNGNQNSIVSDFFTHLRFAIRRQKELFIIPVIGRQIEDLKSLINLFKEAPSQEIGLLDERSAKKLILKPAEGILQYSEDAINAILELSAGHPYFTQLVCHALFSRARQEQNYQIEREDIFAVIDTAIENGEGGLAWFWDGLPLEERLFFTSAAEIQQQKALNFKEDRTVKVEIIEGEPLNLLQEFGVTLNDALREAEKKLIDNKFFKLLDRGTSKNDVYEVTIELVRYWLLKHHPLKRELWHLEELDQTATLLYQVGINLPNRRDKKSIEESIRIFSEALELNPNHFSSLFELADSYLESEYFERAMTLYERAYQVDQNRSKEGLVQSLLGYGRILVGQQKFEQASKIYERVRQLNPLIVQQSSVELLLSEGHELAKQRKYRLAIQRYEKASEIDPSYKQEGLVELLLCYGLELIELKENESAQEQFKRVLTLRPDSFLCQEMLRVASKEILEEPIPQEENSQSSTSWGCLINFLALIGGIVVGIIIFCVIIGFIGNLSPP